MRHRVVTGSGEGTRVMSRNRVVSCRVIAGRRRWTTWRFAIAISVVAVAIWTIDAGSGALADAHVFVISTAAAPASLSSRSLSPAVRIDPPLLVPVAVPEQLVNQSTCRSDLPGAAVTISIADIDYICPVYSGGQSVLDSGAATMISDPALATALTTHPGGVGTMWVAGHRTSHGGPFAAVPTIAIGAIITVTDGEVSAAYRVVGRAHFEIRDNRVVDPDGRATGEATLDSILRADHGANGAPRLLLQTCDGDSARWMIYADLVAGDVPD
jgi:sortase (surface protein transpeptidase)